MVLNKWNGVGKSPCFSERWTSKKMKILANEFVLPFVEGVSCHASHLTLLPDGRVFCVFFYGSKEGNDDIRIGGCFRAPDGTWGELIPITEDDGVPHWNPVLFQKKDGTFVLYYKVGKTIPNWKTYYRTSRDCVTWSEGRELVAGDESGGRGPVRNKAIYLSDGSILAPTSTEQGEWRCFFDRSLDDGATWQSSALLSISPDMAGKYECLDGHGIIQPTVWEDETGAHALMRSTEGKIYRTDSADFEHWCAPYAIEMPNNNSGIDVVRAPDGRLFLACNPINTNGVRTPLSIYVSTDNGMSFSLYTHLTTMKGKYAYPALLWADGCLHVTYTWNRKTITYMCLGEV